MKIIDYNKKLDKKKIAEEAYEICGNAKFPVTFQDVYNHLFENENLILKLLINEANHLAGFGVFENHRLFLNREIITMLYLSGMVIDPIYQRRNISKEIIKNAYRKIQSDLISLRTQNIAMAQALIKTFDDNLLVVPGNVNKDVLNSIKQVSSFENIDEQGIIRNCYPNQLYDDLSAIQNNFGIKLQENDALGVIVEPSKNKQKVLSRFNKIKQ